MDKLKKERLQKKGWKVGDVDEFLGMSPAEMAIVEMKVALAKVLVAKRKSLGETQVSAAIIAKTSQSRYAKVEHADSSVSLELMIKMFFALGATKKELLKTLSASPKSDLARLTPVEARLDKMLISFRILPSGFWLAPKSLTCPIFALLMGQVSRTHDFVARS